MPWEPPEVSEDQSPSSWSPPEVSGWAPPEVLRGPSELERSFEGFGVSPSFGSPEFAAQVQERPGTPTELIGTPFDSLGFAFGPPDPLDAQMSALRAEEIPISSKLAARGAAGLEKGMTMPERAIRGALDLVNYYPALDAVLGTGDKYQQQNADWLKYFNDRDQQLDRETKALGDAGFAGNVVEGVARGAVELPTQLLGGAAGAARGAAIKGAAITAGLTGGLSQYAQDRGAGRDKAESAAYGATSGLITGLTTAAFGATGVESIFKKEGVQGVGRRILEVLKQTGFEGAEESVDQFQQDLLERVTRNPDKPISHSVREILLAGTIGSLMGGAATGAAQLAGAAGSSRADATPEVEPAIEPTTPTEAEFIAGDRAQPVAQELPVKPKETVAVEPLKEAPPPPVEELSPNIDELAARKPGDVTAQEIMSLNSEQAQQLFDKQRANGNANQNDGVLAGLKLNESDVPELTRLRDAAQEKWLVDFSAGKETSLPGKVTWLNGAIEGANRKGANYDLVKDAATPKAPAPEMNVPEAVKIAETAGIRFDGQRPDQWSFTLMDGRKPETSITVKPGATLSEVQAKVEAARKGRGTEAQRAASAKAADQVVEEFLAAQKEGVKPTTAAAKTEVSVSEATPGMAELGAATPESGVTQGTVSGPPLTTLPPVPTVPPKAISQVIRDLSKAVGTPIRFGRLTTRKFGGYFKPLANLIGAKRPNDIQITSHEVGHRLDQTFSLATEPAFTSELMHLGDSARAGSRSSWTKSKTKKYRKSEGVAEFIRYWLTEPAEAAKLAPKLTAHFDSVLKKYPDLESKLVQAREDVHNWRTAEPQARLMSNVSVGANPNQTRYTLKDLTRDVLDDLHYLKLAVEDVKALGGGTLEPSKNPYVMARLLRGAYGVADTFVNRGTVDFKTRNVTAGNSFNDVLKPVSGRLNDFRAYIIARQAREMRAQGKETGLEAGDVDFIYDKFKNDAEFNKSFEDLKQWSDSFIQYAVDAGYLSPESAAAMRKMNQEYVPMHRIFEIGADEFGEAGGGTGRGLNQVGSAFKARHGSRRDIVDPLETYVKNAYSIILNAEKNAVNISVADLAGKPGFGKFVERIGTPKERTSVLVEKIREELERNGADLTKVPDDLVLTMWKDSRIAPRGENIIKVNRGGKLEFYRLSADLYKTMNALDHESASMLAKIVSAPAQVLRAGVTLTPDFAIANATRDTFSSAIISRYGTFPVEHTLRGLYALLKDPQLVAEWKASGGAQSVEAHYYDRASMQEFLREKISKDFSYADYVNFVATSPLKALRILSGTLEEATRIGEYKRVYDALKKEGMAEGDARRQAGFESRDLQDFAMGGAKTKSLRRATAFFNAALQGNYRLYQSLKDPATRYQTVLKGVAWVTVPTVTLFAINKDDEDYWDRPQWERDLFWLIPRGKDDLGHTQFLRVPKPFEIGLIFGTVPERAMAKWLKEDPRAFDGLAEQFINQSIPNPVPQALLTAAEVSAGPEGYSWYKHRPIVPKSMERMPAELQFSQQNSVTAKRIGQALGVSPMKVDHAIAGTTGTLGKTAVNQGVDRVLEWLTDDQRTARSTYPGARFIATPAGTQSQAVENFYNELTQLRQEHARTKKPGVRTSWGGRLLRFENASEKLSDLRQAQRKATDDTRRQEIALQMRKVAENALR